MYKYNFDCLFLYRLNWTKSHTEQKIQYWMVMDTHIITPLLSNNCKLWTENPELASKLVDYSCSSLSLLSFLKLHASTCCKYIHLKNIKTQFSLMTTNNGCRLSIPQQEQTQTVKIQEVLCGVFLCLCECLCCACVSPLCHRRSL